MLIAILMRPQENMEICWFFLLYWCNLTGLIGFRVKRCWILAVIFHFCGLVMLHMHIRSVLEHDVWCVLFALCSLDWRSLLLNWNNRLALWIDLAVLDASILQQQTLSCFGILRLLGKTIEESIRWFPLLIRKKIQLHCRGKKKILNKLVWVRLHGLSKLSFVTIHKSIPCRWRPCQRRWPKVIPLPAYFTLMDTFDYLVISCFFFPVDLGANAMDYL